MCAHTELISIHNLCQTSLCEVPAVGRVQSAAPQITLGLVAPSQPVPSAIPPLSLQPFPLQCQSAMQRRVELNHKIMNYTILYIWYIHSHTIYIYRRLRCK